MSWIKYLDTFTFNLNAEISVWLTPIFILNFLSRLFTILSLRSTIWRTAIEMQTNINVKYKEADLC